ncbi:hypothetical protein TNCV_4454651 [Trichonephila clavipes]|nr:hypothetical protein TNCV_4454651 [Trichonephila clavipes]
MKYLKVLLISLQQAAALALMRVVRLDDWGKSLSSLTSSSAFSLPRIFTWDASNTKALDDRPRNFEPRSNGGDTPDCIRLFKLPYHATEDSKIKVLPLTWCGSMERGGQLRCRCRYMSIVQSMKSVVKSPRVASEYDVN